MNKYKKLAIAAVSMVMAGSMVFAACNNNKKPGGFVPGDNGQEELTPSNDNGKLTYAAGTTIDVSIGYNSPETGIRYTSKNISALGTDTKLMGSQSDGNFKPAWKGFQDITGITLNDEYNGKSTGNQIADIQQTQDGIAGVTVFTASASTISNLAMEDRETFLDLYQYLDYMPNYKAFLEQTDIITASLIFDSTSGAMYMAPYFDGNDDIEKFVLMRKDLVETLLDGTDTSSTTTFKAQADKKNDASQAPAAGAGSIIGTKSSIKSFMGTTGSWTIDVTDPSVLSGTPSVGTNKNEVTNATATVKVTINYDKALEDAKTGEIATVLKTVTGVTDDDVSGQTSGNIVDIMNLAINKSQGAVTGGQLVQILRRYIDVAYLTEGGASFYASANNGLKRSEVFNGASAAWDADLYAALGRVFVTCGSMLGDGAKDMGLTYLIAGRQYTVQRTTDVSALAGELYGARGLESRYNFSYIDAKGKMKDGRSDKLFWDALERMNDLTKEGLFNTSNNVVNNQASHSGSGNGGIQTLSLHDYVQTQTSAVGFESSVSYNFAPILTPVSHWDTDGNGTQETTMRFTESWRSVKTEGLAISYRNVKDDPDKLAAALALIDYMYSPDGQIMFTYGPRSTNGNAAEPNGLWYATEVTDKTPSQVADVIPGTEGLQYVSTQYTMKKEYKAQYFVYDGKVYTGTFYNGRQIPTLTDENLGVFNNQSKNNFTNHARQFLGTTLPAGNKDQGFEYQCTARCGIVGSQIVNIALNNDTIKHPSQTIDKNNLWYTIVPTQLSYDKDTSNAISTGFIGMTAQNTGATGMYTTDSKAEKNLLLDIMYYGYDTNLGISGINSTEVKIPENAEKMIELHNSAEGFELARLLRYKQEAWENILFVLGIEL